jgi:hypothetical protein
VQRGLIRAEISEKTDRAFVLTAHAHQASMRSVEIY